MYPHCYILMLMSGSPLKSGVIGYELSVGGGALLEFPMMTAMQGKSLVSSAISVCDKYRNFTPVAAAQ